MRLLTLAFLVATPLLAQSFTLTRGPVDYQVYQRNAEGKADIPLELEAKDAEGRDVFVTLRRGLVPVPGFISQNLGKVSGGKLVTAVKGVPTGGPYRLELRASRVGAALVARSNVLVGDIWLLAGQSNMEGVGDLVDVEKPSDKVNSFNQADQWVNATEPLHELPSAVDRVHWRGKPEALTGEALAQFRANRKKGAGLGLAFAVEYEKRTGVPVGLLPCANGGTSMDQWSPALKDKGGDSLYGQAIRRAQVVGPITGILWYQGESDANPRASAVFQEKFENLVAAFRKDLNQPSLPFHYVQIGRHVNSVNMPYWNLVQEGQRLAEGRLGNAVMFAAIDADLDDGIHVSTTDLKRLGRNMAAVAAGKLKKGPHLAGLSLEGQTVRVRYTEVNGKLTSEGRIGGFAALTPQGDEFPLFYKMQVDPADGNSVLLHFQGQFPAGTQVSYGHGKNPYANLRDGAGLAAPVFGPLAVVE